MNKQIPSIGKLAIMIGFTLLCFVLILWLWLSFGGSAPLKPKGYRIEIPFGEATQLAGEADVRISGVTVGKVKDLVARKEDGLSIATVEIKPEFAPLPANTRATLRQKTLVGETYVMLSPGSRRSRMLTEGEMLARANVRGTVELDEALRALDPTTRKNLQNWIAETAVALDGRSAALSNAIGLLPGFERETTRTLRLLNEQSAELRAFTAQTGEMLTALTERDGRLRALIDGGSRVFAATGRRSEELAATMRALPTFQREATALVRRLTKFADHTEPLVRELMPAARELDPTIRPLARLAPQLAELMRAIQPLERASRRGLPATSRLLAELRSFLPEVDAPLAQLTPIVDGLSLYRHDLTAMLGNATAATQYSQSINGEPRQTSHVLRVTNPINPEGVSLYNSRLPTNRQNAYPQPHTADRLLGGKPVLDARSCGSDLTLKIDNDSGALSGRLIDSLMQIAFNNGDLKGPPCIQQGPFSLGTGTTTQFPQLGSGAAGIGGQRR